MKQTAGSTVEENWLSHCLTIDTMSSQYSRLCCQRYNQSVSSACGFKGIDTRTRAAWRWSTQMSLAWCSEPDSLIKILRAPLRYRAGKASRTAERLSSRAARRACKRSEGFCVRRRWMVAASRRIVVVTMCILKLKSPLWVLISLIVFHSIPISAGRNIADLWSEEWSAAKELVARAVLILSTSTTKGVAAVMFEYESRQ